MHSVASKLRKILRCTIGSFAAARCICAQRPAALSERPGLVAPQPGWMVGEVESRSMPLVAAIIVAAGRGTRARPHALPKQYRPLAGRPLVAHSLEATLRHPAIAKVLCVIHPDDQAIYDEIA